MICIFSEDFIYKSNFLGTFYHSCITFTQVLFITVNTDIYYMYIYIWLALYIRTIQKVCVQHHIHQSQVQRDHSNCISASHLVLAGGLASQIQMAELGGGRFRGRSRGGGGGGGGG